MYDYSEDSDYEAEMIVEFTGMASDLEDLRVKINNILDDYNGSIEIREI